jgi:hypothetical protein
MGHMTGLPMHISMQKIIYAKNPAVPGIILLNIFCEHPEIFRGIKSLPQIRQLVGGIKGDYKLEHR